MRFNNCAVASPLCGPSRACLASGVHYDSCGVIQHESDWPFATMDSFYRRLRDDAGYHVLGTGKLDLNKYSVTRTGKPGADGKNGLADWGFSDGINNMGKWDGYREASPTTDPWYKYLDDNSLLTVHKNDYLNRRNGGTWNNFTNTSPTPLPDSAYNDNWLAQNARNLIAAAPGGTPWFCQVNFGGPHEPNDITSSMDSTRTGYPAPYDHSSTITNHNAIRRNYTAMIENIDRELGLFINQLQGSGQLDNTIIIYTSDHGEMLGDHNRWEKKSPYRQSVGVPLYARGPGIQAGVASNALVSLIDLAATCMDYGGLPTPAGMHARSIRPVLEGSTTSHRDYVLSGISGWRMVFDGQHKLIRGFDTGSTGNGDGSDIDAPPVLFDLNADPDELANIASAQPAKVRELSAILDRETHGFTVGNQSYYR
jgi:arylsulfatase A-like enzyme